MNNTEYTPDIMYGLFGSHLYGLNNENSDEDWKGIFMPTLPDLLLHSYPNSIKTSTGGATTKNGAGDVDDEYVSLPRFVELGCKSDTMAIDMLHIDMDVMHRDHPLMLAGKVDSDLRSVWDSLVEHRTKFYSKDMSSLIGYLKHQASKYGVKGSRMASIKVAIEVVTQLIEEYPDDTVIGTVTDWLPYDNNCKLITVINTKTNPHSENTFYEVLGKKYQTTMSLTKLLNSLTIWYDSYGHRAREAEKNQGIDWKAVSHALRAGYQVIDIFEKGDYEYPLSQTQYIRDVKEGKLDFKNNVQLELEVVTDRAMELSELSTLPEKVNRTFWDNWLLCTYDKHLL